MHKNRLAPARLLAACLVLAFGVAGCASPSGLTRAERTALAERERSFAASTRRVFDADLVVRIARLAAAIDPTARLRIYVIDDPAPQAQLFGGELLLVRTGLLQAAPGDAELGFVVGHELAHAALGHVQARRLPGWDAAGAERAADAWALERARRLGLTPAAASQLLARLAARLDGTDRDAVLARAAALVQGRAF